jgi:hypothetical protein
MSNRGFIGAFSNSRQAARTPIKAVEGVIGVVILLAYHAGGKNLFPSDVTVDMYVDEIAWVPRYGRAVKMDDEQFSGLIEAMAASLERHMKVVTPGSLKNYLSHLRNGKRPNGGGSPPLVETVYKSDGSLTIYPRVFATDRAGDEWEKVPLWVRLMVERQEYLEDQANDGQST